MSDRDDWGERVRRESRRRAAGGDESSWFTVKKSIIAGVISLQFAALIWVVGDVQRRLRALEELHVRYEVALVGIQERERRVAATEAEIKTLKEDTDALQIKVVVLDEINRRLSKIETMVERHVLGAVR